MGRAKKSRGKEQRKAAASGFSLGSDSESSEIRIENRVVNKQDVMAGLGSPDRACRENACAMLASIFSLPHTRNEMTPSRILAYSKLATGGVVNHLIRCLFDQEDPRIREMAASAIRNMCACGQETVLKKLISEDVLTPLIKHLEELCVRNQADQEKHRRALLLQILGALCHLLDFSEHLVLRFTRGNGPSCLLQLLQPPHQDLDMVTAAVQILCIASESNEMLGAQLSSMDQALEFISQLRASEAMPLLVRLYAAGILTNVYSQSGNTELLLSEVHASLSLLSACLRYDPAATAQTCATLDESAKLAAETLREAQEAAKQEDGATNPEVGLGDVLEQEQEALLKTWGDQVAPLKLALEYVTNLCSEGAEDEEEKEWASDDEDEMEQLAAMDAQASLSASPVLSLLSDPSLFAQVLSTFQAVCSPIHMLPVETAKLIADDVLTLRHVAGCCISNMISSLSIPALGDVGTLWACLCQMAQDGLKETVLLFQGLLRETVNSGGTAPDLWYQSLTGALVVLLKRFSADLMAAGVVNDEAVGTLLGMCQWGGSHEVRINALACLGALGTQPHTHEQNLIFAQALVGCLADPHLLVQAEAMNAIMDVYADIDHDQGYVECGLSATLEPSVSAFKIKVKHEGQSLGREAFLFLKETSLNISRFQKYKQNKLAK